MANEGGKGDPSRGTSDPEAQAPPADKGGGKLGPIHTRALLGGISRDKDSVDD